MTELTNNITKFWNWFEGNEEALKKMFGCEDESLRLEFRKQFTNLPSGLGYDTAYSNSSKIIFVISANDNESLFPIVLEIIKKAPKLNGWDFIAFRPRHPREEFTMEVGDLTIRYSDLFFEQIQNQEKFTAKLYIKNDSKFLLEYGFCVTLMLHDIIGEYDNVKKVNWLSWETLKESNKKIIPIINIVKQLDEFKNIK